MCRGSASRRARRPQVPAARASAPVRTPSTLAWLKWGSSRLVSRRLQVQVLPCQPDFGSCMSLRRRMWGRKEVIRQTHDLETAGSNPVPATNFPSNKPNFVLTAPAGRTAPLRLRPWRGTAAWRRITVGNGGKGALPTASRRIFGFGPSRQARPSCPRRKTAGIAAQAMRGSSAAYAPASVGNAGP